MNWNCLPLQKIKRRRLFNVLAKITYFSLGKKRFFKRILKDKSNKNSSRDSKESRKTTIQRKLQFLKDSKKKYEKITREMCVLIIILIKGIKNCVNYKEVVEICVVRKIKWKRNKLYLMDYIDSLKLTQEELYINLFCR